MPATDPTATSDAAPAVVPGGARQNWPAWVEPALLACLFAAAFLVRLWPIWQVHFWDEAVYLQNAEFICCGKTNYSELASRPPFLSLLYAGVFRLWHHVYAASIFTAALNALGPIFLYLAGRKPVGRTAAAIAALLLAFAPFFVDGNTGNSLLTDSPALTLILISLWLALRSTERGAGIWSGSAGLVSALAFLTRFASMPAVGMISLLMFRSERWFRAVVWFGAGFAIGVAPYLVWSKVGYGGFLATLQTGWVNVGGSAEPTLYYLQHFVDVFSWMALIGIGLWFVAVVLDVRSGQAHEGDKVGGWDAYLWAWALLALAYFTAIPHKELRYVLPLAPAVLLLAGRGLAVLVRSMDRKRRWIGTAVLVAALAYGFAPDLRRFRGPLVSPFISEEKEVADFLNAKARPGATLYINFNAPVFGYYTALPTHVVLEQDASFYQAFPRNMPKDGYLLVYKQVEKDPRQDWIESNPDFHFFQEFPSLTIYEYRASRKGSASP